MMKGRLLALTIITMFKIYSSSNFINAYTSIIRSHGTHINLRADRCTKLNDRTGKGTETYIESSALKERHFDPNQVIRQSRMCLQIRLSNKSSSHALRVRLRKTVLHWGGQEGMCVEPFSLYIPRY